MFLVNVRHFPQIMVTISSTYYLGFCYGSSWKNWRNLANFARKYSLLFIPSVGPGYDG